MHVRRVATRWRAGEGRLVLSVVVLVLVTRLPTLGQPLVERHDWRQTQTAFTALIYAESGIDLLHPKVPVLGPPFEVPHEFPLFQAVASIPIAAGMPPDLALRLLCLVTFIASALFLWGLVRRVAGGPAALATLLFYSFSPLALLWSRTSMIEYTAVAGALAMVWAGVAWRDRPSASMWALAFGGAMVAMLVKPTTGVFYLLPLFGYRSARETARLRDLVRARLDPRLLVIAVVPIVAAVAWTRHADAIKAASALTAPYTSQGLSLWYFSTVAQRLQPENWVMVGRRVIGAIAGVSFAPLIAPAIGPVLRSRQALFWLAMAGVAILPILVLFNPYVEHDYYFVAVSPAWAAFLGVGGVWVWARIPNRRLRYAAVALAVAVTVVTTGSYVAPIYQSVSDPSGVLPMASELAALSRPDDQVLVLGRDWSPSVHYYARRAGLAMPREFLPHPAGDPGDWSSEWSWPRWIDRTAAQTRAATDYRIMISSDPMVDPIWLGGRWPWMGVLGPRTYIMGNVLTELRGAGLIATDTAVAPPSGRQVIASSMTIPCRTNVVVDVPTGSRGTWITVSTATAREARIRISPALAPILAKRVIFASPKAAPPNALMHVSCAGTAAVVIEAVTDGEPPGQL